MAESMARSAAKNPERLPAEGNGSPQRAKNVLYYKMS